MRYYIDTSIWRDLLEDRRDNIKPLSEFAFKLMEKILREKHTVVFSKEIEVELRRRFKVEQIDELALKELIKENLLMYVEANPLQLKEAKALSAEIDVPFLDAVHAIIARDVSAVLVTRDKHFEELRHIVEVKLPEEVTSYIQDKAP